MPDRSLLRETTPLSRRYQSDDVPPPPKSALQRAARRPNPQRHPRHPPATTTSSRRHAPQRLDLFAGQNRGRRHLEPCIAPLLLPRLRLSDRHWVVDLEIPSARLEILIYHVAPGGSPQHISDIPYPAPRRRAEFEGGTFSAAGGWWTSDRACSGMRSSRPPHLRLTAGTQSGRRPSHGENTVACPVIVISTGLKPQRAILWTICAAANF